jgi:hypothetical protein
MTDVWTQAVRHQLGLGRLLPLGGPRDGAWLTERAADSVLRRVARHVPGVRLGTLRLALADPEQTYVAAVPPPPSALPPGPLRISAEFAATADLTAPEAEPLPMTATRLRTALASAAEERLGLTVTDVDLRVTGLLGADAGADETDVHPGEGQRTKEPEPRPEDRPDSGPDDDESRVAAATLSVPGVARLTGALGGLGRAVHIEEHADEDHAGEAALPRRHVRVEIEVHADERALDVAREVRSTVTEALPDHPSVAVLVTGVTD